MPTISGAVTNLAANAVSDDELDDSTYQVLPFKALVQVGARHNAADSSINMTFQGGGIALMDDDPISGSGTAGVLPVIPDDFIVSEILPAGTRLSLRFRETGGASTTDILWVVKITPA